MRIKKFHIAFTAYFGGSSDLFKKGRELIYFQRELPVPYTSDPSFGEMIRMKPAPAQWVDFLESLKRFKWDGEYFGSDICDGVQWEVKIVSDIVTLRAEGSNNFPDDFDAFLDAVRRFAGDRVFEGRSW